MPVYEFTCSSCGHNFDKLCKISHNLTEIQCPKCGANAPKKRLSLFGCCTGNGSTGSSCSGCSSGNCSTCGH